MANLYAIPYSAGPGDLHTTANLYTASICNPDQDTFRTTVNSEAHRDRYQDSSTDA
jgi:hypothetical protein